MTDSIYVYMADLPSNVHEMVTPCIDGYSIYINTRLSCVEQEKAYRHAIWHIENLDFEKDSVQSIEKIAHEGVT